MNFDVANMNPAQMRGMLNMLAVLPDEQVTALCKKMGVDIDPVTLKSFVQNMKDATDDDFNRLKEQFKSGTINMNSFKPNPYKKYLTKIEEANKLMKDNKLNESIELCNKTIEEIKAEKPEEEAAKKEVKEILGKAFDQLTLSRFTTEDYDTTIKECIACNEEEPVFSVYNRLGICYFKKGRHVKARDAFNKAKELFPDKKDTIADKYLKMALEEIENY